MIVPARHIVIVDQRVHGCFLDRLHNAGKNWIEQIVRDCFNRMCDVIGVRDLWIGCGKGNKQIAGAVSGDAAGARESKRDAARQSFQLMRQQRRVGCDHRDA